MKRILIFFGGALFGAGLLFGFLMMRPLALAVDPAREIAKSAPPAAPAPVPVTSPAHPAAASAPGSQPVEAAATPIASPSVPRPPSADPPSPTAGPLPARPQPGSLLIPLAGVDSSRLLDTFNQGRGDGQAHEAIDIAAPKGTPVVAVDDGRVVKLFNSKRGGLTVYQFDPAEKLAYYYAHLDGYAPGLAEGRELKRGELVGYVGSTGNANPAAPHLHFAIFELGPEKRWWQGTAINPYPLFIGR
jgi:murein DD-endopeptidase MepM/ murein hydrolase activator NlpD